MDLAAIAFLAALTLPSIGFPGGVWKTATYVTAVAVLLVLGIGKALRWAATRGSAVLVLPMPLYDGAVSWP